MKKVCKQVRDQIVWKQVEVQLKGCYRMKINSKAFAIPILTASSLYVVDNITVRIGIPNALEFITVL